MTTATDERPKKKPARRSVAHRVARALLDTLLAVACVYVGWLIVASAVESANNRAQLKTLTHEAEILFTAFERYQERNHEYPASYTPPSFDLTTGDPLKSRGYYRGPIRHALLNHRFDAYDSPDDRGSNNEFWLEMSLANDPSIRVLLAHSDKAPLGGGEWREGVFVYRDGVLEPL